jgi:predicted nucleic acid-binding protein
MEGGSRVIDLDANFLVDALSPESPEATVVAAWMASGESLGISAVAWGEFLCGPLTAQLEAAARELLPEVRSLEQADAETAAELFNLSGRRSRSFADCCIAACAIGVDARLATSNEDDFKRIVPHGLQLA